MIPFSSRSVICAHLWRRKKIKIWETFLLNIFWEEVHDFSFATNWWKRNILRKEDPVNELSNGKEEEEDGKNLSFSFRLCTILLCHAFARFRYHHWIFNDCLMFILWKSWFQVQRTFLMFRKLIWLIDWMALDGNVCEISSFFNWWRWTGVSNYKIKS